MSTDDTRDTSPTERKDIPRPPVGGDWEDAWDFLVDLYDEESMGIGLAADMPDEGTYHNEPFLAVDHRALYRWNDDSLEWEPILGLGTSSTPLPDIYVEDIVVADSLDLQGADLESVTNILLEGSTNRIELGDFADASLTVYDTHNNESVAVFHTGGAVDIDLADMESGAAADGEVATADGAGNVTWADPDAGGASSDATYVTTADESTDLPNSEQHAALTGSDLHDPAVHDNTQHSGDGYIPRDGSEAWTGDQDAANQELNNVGYMAFGEYQGGDPGIFRTDLPSDRWRFYNNAGDTLLGAFLETGQFDLFEGALRLLRGTETHAQALYGESVTDSFAHDVSADVYDVSHNDTGETVYNYDRTTDVLDLPASAITVGGTVDGVDVSAHEADADAHHAQDHDNADHTTDMVEDATTTGNGPYEVQKDGTDGTGVINFKTS